MSNIDDIFQEVCPATTYVETSGEIKITSYSNAKSQMLKENSSIAMNYSEGNELDNKICIIKADWTDVTSEYDKKAEEMMEEQEFIPPPTVLYTVFVDYLYKTTSSFTYSRPYTLPLLITYISYLTSSSSVKKRAKKG